MMIKTFVLTMVFGAYSYGGGVATTEFPVLADCEAAASAFVKEAGRFPMGDGRAWCVEKNTPEPTMQK